MNTVFVWGAPIADEEIYIKLTETIINFFKENLKHDVVVFFPKDLMKWDIGKEMAVYVSCQNLRPDLKQSLAITIGLLVREAFRPEKIFCSVLDEPKRGEGYWSYL